MIVTVSASYGAGGSALAPRLAHALGVPFVDRAIPVGVTQELGISIEEADSFVGERDRPNRLWSLLAAMYPAGALAVPVPTAQPGDRELVDALEAHLLKVADEGGAVVLGHAAAVVLADRPDALHVRLDGPRDGRVRAAMRQHGIGQDAAAAEQADNDEIRAAYVKRFYGVDPASPALYHLVLDTVRLGWDESEKLILQAARGLSTS